MTTLNILGKEVKTGTLYTVELPKPTVVPTDGRQLIHQLLRNSVNGERFSSDPQDIYRPFFDVMQFFDQDEHWEWLVRKGEYAGTLPKRLSSLVYKQAGFNLPPAIMSEIGNIARRYTSGMSTYHFDFTRTFDWDDGDFGDGGSCFWGGRSRAKDIIHDADGFALRFYRDAADSSSGYARCWIIPHPDRQMLILFNIYGMKGNGIVMPRILSEFLGVPYKGQTVPFENNGSCDDTLYINNGSCWLVGQDSQTYSGSIDLELPDDDRYECYACGERCTDEWIHDGDAYCEDCYHERLVECDDCSRMFDRDDAFEYGGYTYCTRCRNNMFSMCDDCGEWYRDSDGYTTHDGRGICDSCYGDDYFTCQHCHEIHPDREQNDVQGQDWCDDCARDCTFTCDTCGQTFPDTDLAGERGNETWCENCGVPKEDNRERETA